MLDHKHLHPMLIGIEKPAFNDPEFYYEIKLDGVRCIAYIDADGVELRNKRDMNLTNKFPELRTIYKQVKKPCILDGELYVYKHNLTDFFEIQKRTLTSDVFKNTLASRKYPATFTAFDVLYVEDTSMLQTPLYKRKAVLKKLVMDNERINVSHYIEEYGVELFELTTKANLEGIVAKRKDSVYHLGKRTSDWMKCKNMLDDDFVVCGYIQKERGMVSLILAQWRNQMLLYKGHVTMGVSLSYIESHCTKTNDIPFAIVPKGNQDAVWIKPMLVGCVRFMEYTNHGGLRQPVF